MKLVSVSPAIRFADKLLYTRARRLSKTYDCRLLYVLEGRGELSADGSAFEIQPGMLVLFQPETAYRFLPAPSFHAIAVDFDLTGGFETEGGALPPLPLADFDADASHGRIRFDDTDFLADTVVEYDAQRFGEKLERLLAEFRGTRLYGREMAALMLKELLLELARGRTVLSKSARTVERVLEYIALHYREELTNESIAAVFNHDPCYLSRAVKRHTGDPIHRLIIKQRLEVGIRLLITTDAPLESIAEQVGFYSAAHFCKRCKALTGKSPSFYRRESGI